LCLTISGWVILSATTTFISLFSLPFIKARYLFEWAVWANLKSLNSEISTDQASFCGFSHQIRLILDRSRREFRSSPPQVLNGEFLTSLLDSSFAEAPLKDYSCFLFLAAVSKRAQATWGREAAATAEWIGAKGNAPSFSFIHPDTSQNYSPDHELLVHR
jgi:hypothetical protein